MASKLKTCTDDNKHAEQTIAAGAVKIASLEREMAESDGDCMK